VLRLPEQLRRSLTWDHGREMAEHIQFTIDSGVRVYFCDPRSPWQRGTNENTNGLLANTCPRVPTYASSTRLRWMPSPLSSMAALDKPSASRHPHRHSRRRCADPLRPPPFLQQPPAARVMAAVEERLVIVLSTAEAALDQPPGEGASHGCPQASARRLAADGEEPDRRTDRHCGRDPAQQTGVDLARWTGNTFSQVSRRVGDGRHPAGQAGR
jgi:hypothetical protein